MHELARAGKRFVLLVNFFISLSRLATDLVLNRLGGEGAAGFCSGGGAAFNFSPQSSASGGQKAATKFPVSCFGTRV